MKAMPKMSALVSTFLLGLIAWKLSLWNVLEPKDRNWTALVFIYTALTAAAGWAYYLTWTKIWGYAHVLFMFGIAGGTGYVAVVSGTGHWLTGSTGPGANSMGWLLQAIVLLYCIVAFVTAACGITVWIHAGKNGIRRSDE